MTPIDTPSLEYGALSPILIVLGAAFVSILVEAFVPRTVRYLTQLVVTVGSLVAATVATVWVAIDLDVVEGATAARGGVVAEGAVAVDGPAVFLWGTILLLSIVSMLMFAERSLEGGAIGFTARAATAPGTDDEHEAQRRGLEHTEVFPLALFAIGGMLLFCSAHELILMFIALELLSLPLYLLCALARRRRLLSQEAAMKYFLLGAFSSAFFLYGIALVYGYSGSLSLTGVAAAVENRTDGQALLLGGMALLAVGLLFKVSAVPFHAWTPDVYQGAPTPVTGFMAACTKVAAFGALLRLFYVAFGEAQWDWKPAIAVVAVITMVVGSVVAISQSDVKRMLAYSSVAHAGFILVGFVGATGGTGEGITSTEAVLFYLVTYGFATLGAFAIVTMVRDAGGEVTALSRWAGLGKESPVVAGAFAFFLLAFAGIPLTSGFMGKWTVFSAAWSGDLWPLVVVAVVMSAVAAFFYVRVIVLMFFTEPDGELPSVAVPGILTTVVVVVALGVTVALGVMPGPVLELAQSAGAFVR